MATQYLVALVHYSRAIKLHSKEAVFFSNRALVYLKLNRFYEAISDCTASIDRKPSIKVENWIYVNSFLSISIFFNQVCLYSRFKY